MYEVVVDQLTIYPVKSLAGISLPESQLDTSGLAGDRHWAIFKSDNHPLTQRQNPRMALITPRFNEQGTERGDLGLVLSAEGYGQIEVRNPKPDAAIASFTVWKDTCYGVLADAEVNQWLAEVLQEKDPLRLAKIAPNEIREFNQPERFSVKGPYFSDAAPYLLANTQSLEALNQHLADQSLREIDMRHFRANIVVSGAPAFSEHALSKLSSPDQTLQFQLIDHCQRCSMITVDPDSGQFLPKAHPFKALSQLNPMPHNAKAPAFGVNTTLSVNANNSRLKVGQKLFFS